MIPWNLNLSINLTSPVAVALHEKFVFDEKHAFLEPRGSKRNNGDHGINVVRN